MGDVLHAFIYVFVIVCTDRAEVCVKASELDAVSDRLAKEQQRARELQWEAERERSRADRRAEGEREELEVSDITASLLIIASAFKWGGVI